jgi:YbbR domain-containing protein
MFFHKKQKTEKPKSSGAKTELANRIAEQSRKMDSSYEKIGSFMARLVRLFSQFLDKVLFNQKHAKLVSLILAILMYGVVNYRTITAVFTTSLQSSRSLSDIPVTAEYSNDTYEISGLPSSVDITITGDASNVTNAAGSSDGTVVADLTDFTEGQHEVQLEARGYGSAVKVVVDPSTVIVTMKKKTTREFDISYDFIHTDQMDDIYTPGTPSFDTTKVNVRASEDTLNNIAFIKALIDCSSQSENFEQDARLAAYDNDGNLVSVDIIPDTVHVRVPVSSPNKKVPVHVKVDGTIPDNKAISSIELDQKEVTIYGPDSVLSSVEEVTVTLDAADLTGDAVIKRPITLPAGVSTASVSEVSLDVKLGSGVRKTIGSVDIQYINNTAGYRAVQPDNQTTVSVTAWGTRDNVKDIKADDVYVYVDLSGASPGLSTYTLQVRQPDSGLVQFTVDDPEYELNIIGEESQNEGAETNNG